MEFERLYREQYGYGCTACQFKTTFSAWKSQSQTNTKTMSNTFILVKPNALYRVNENEVLSKNSPDEIALAWLSLDSYGGNKMTKENKEKIFKKLPAGYGESEKKEEVKEAPKKKTQTKK